MKHGHLSRRLVLLPAVALLALGLAASAPAAERVIRFGAPDPGGATPAGKSMEVFKQLVEKGTNGQIKVQLFYALQLGPIVEQIQAVRDGGQEMMISTPAWFSRFYPKIDVMSLPYLVTDWESASRMISSPAFGALVTEAESATKIKILGTFPLGFRHTINKKTPIEKLEDFARIKFRLQDSPSQLASFRALGANPVALPWGEVYQALQTGVIDGLEAPLYSHHAMKFYEVAPYVSKTAHFFEVFLVYLNPAFFNASPPEHQKLMREAIKTAAGEGQKVVQEMDDKAEAGLRAAGAKINAVSPAAVASFRKAVQPVYQEFGAKFEPHFSALQKAAAGK